MTDISPPIHRTAFSRALLTTWGVTAIWDGACATALSLFAYGSTFSALWSGVAATALADRREPTPINAALGLLIHAGVAMVWSSLFVSVLFSSARLRRALKSRLGVVVVAAIYGPLIWLFMSLGAIPYVTGRDPSFGLRWWVQLVAHVPFVTLPMVITARSFIWRGDQHVFQDTNRDNSDGRE